MADYLDDGYDPDDIEDSLDDFLASLDEDDTPEPEPLGGEDDEDEEDGDIDPNTIPLDFGDYTVGDLEGELGAKKATSGANAAERLEMARTRLAQGNARFEDWLKNLPIRDADKEELRQRRRAAEERAIERLAMSLRAEDRAIERLNMTRQDREISLTKPFIAQPKPLPAPKEPAAPAKLSWQDVSLFLDPGEEEALADAWANGGTGAGMISAMRLRQLMSSLPLDNSPNMFLRRLRSMWSQSGTRQSVSRAPTVRTSSPSSSSPRPVRTIPPRGPRTSVSSVS